MQLRTIVVATDFSPCSQVAVEYAARWIGDREVDVVLAHVVRPTEFPVRHVLRSRGFPNFQEEVMKGTARQLEDIAGPAFGGRAVRCVAKTGNPVVELAAVCDEVGADLAVVGTHGRSGWRQLLLGSTADGLLRTASCPVLVVHTGDEQRFDPAALHCVLAPTDFSPAAEDGLRIAASVAREREAELVVLHVFDEPLPIDGPIELGEQELLAMRDEARAAAPARLDEVARSLGLTAVRTDIRDGDPADGVREAALAHGAELVVLSTSGVTGVQRMLLGSTAARIVASAPCPVLAVRAGGGAAP